MFEGHELEVLSVGRSRLDYGPDAENHNTDKQYLIKTIRACMKKTDTFNILSNIFMIS